MDLADAEDTEDAVRQADPDLVLHLAAESHVDRSISGPEAFINSNVHGTFHLLQAIRTTGKHARAPLYRFPFSSHQHR